MGTLNFDETVNSVSLNPLMITLQNKENAGLVSTTDFSLNGVTSRTKDGTSLVLGLRTDDLDEIKKLTNLAVSASSTFLTFTDAMVTDMNIENKVVARDLNSALPCDDFTAGDFEFVEDVTQPILLTVSLNLNSGLMSFTFDETVEADSIDCTKITMAGDTSEYIL